MPAAPPARPCQLTFFPDYRSANPYQALLYDQRLGPGIEGLPGTVTDALQRQAAHADRPAIFHLHWEHATLTEPRASAEAVLNDIATFRDRGGRVIWTIHNLFPHDPGLRARTADLQAGLIELADVLHLHSLPATAAARRHLALPARKIRIIPHPNYAGAYPHVSRAVARPALRLPDASMVVLMPGRIAAYKRPADLVTAFLGAAGPEDRLIVAGHRAAGTRLEIPADPRVIIREGFAAPEEVSSLHAAADLVALPYAQSLTSGSAILAATLGRAVLGPDLPGLRDAVEPPRTGLLYDPDAEGALAAALAAALAEGPGIWAARGAEAARLAAARDGGMIAAAWRDLIAGLVAVPRCGRAAP